MTVGYPSIDKPWLKYYDQSKLNALGVKRTVWRELYENNLDHASDVAIEFFRTKTTYANLFASVERCAAALAASGVGKGDIVTVVCAGTPEMVCLFYSLARIGAIANMMSPFFDHDDMVNRINDCGSDLAFIMDEFWSEVQAAIETSCVKEAVIVPVMNSSLLRFAKRSPVSSSSDLIRWNRFMKRGKGKAAPEVPYEADTPLVIVYSSGTTGASKGILLSHDSFQNSIHAYGAVGVDVSRGQKFYQIIPPWFSTGVNTCIHLPLSYGATVLMDPRFEREVFVRNIVKHRPNYTVAATSIYEGFLDETLVGSADLSFFNHPFQGGEVLPPETSEAIETVFKKHGSGARLLTGYGQCECGATVTTMIHGVNHPVGCAGIPLPGVTVGIFDDDFNELGYKERGNVLVDTPCGMLRYLKNTIATEEYFHVDDDGVKWSRTGDVGYIDEHGNLFVEGRASDYSVIGGQRFYNFDVEAALMKDGDILLVDVMESVLPEGGSALVAHVVLVPEKKLANDVELACIFARARASAVALIGNDDAVPHRFKVWDVFPKAPSGKKDATLMKSSLDGVVVVPTAENDELSNELT